MSQESKGKSTGQEDARNSSGKGSMSEESKGKSTGPEDARDSSGKGSTSQESKGEVQARRMEETSQEKQVHLEKAKARRMEETLQEKLVCLEKAQKKRETEIEQKICESKGFIEYEQQWLITGSLHKPAEFTCEEEQEDV